MKYMKLLKLCDAIHPQNNCKLKVYCYWELLRPCIKLPYQVRHKYQYQTSMVQQYNKKPFFYIYIFSIFY